MNLFEVTLPENMRFVDTFSKINELGEFCVSNKLFYLETDFTMDKLCSELDIVGIRKITENNFEKLEPPTIRGWCRAALIRQELERFKQSEEGKTLVENINAIVDKVKKEENALAEQEDTSKNGAKNQIDT